MKTKKRRVRRAALNPCEEALRRLVKAPETALKIYELAESLYMRDGDDVAGRQTMSFADIELVGDYLRQAENDIAAMKKQFLDLAVLEGDFQTDRIPIGF